MYSSGAELVQYQLLCFPIPKAEKIHEKIHGTETSSPQGKSLNKHFKRNVQPFPGCLINLVGPKPVSNKTVVLEAILTPAVQMADSVDGQHRSACSMCQHVWQVYLQLERQCY
jgi:hypothetical protein